MENTTIVIDLVPQTNSSEILCGHVYEQNAQFCKILTDEE